MSSSDSESSSGESLDLEHEINAALSGPVSVPASGASGGFDAAEAEEEGPSRAEGRGRGKTVHVRQHQHGHQQQQLQIVGHGGGKVRRAAVRARSSSSSSGSSSSGSGSGSESEDNATTNKPRPRSLFSVMAGASVGAMPVSSGASSPSLVAPTTAPPQQNPSLALPGLSLPVSSSSTPSAPNNIQSTSIRDKARQPHQHQPKERLPNTVARDKEKPPQRDKEIVALKSQISKYQADLRRASEEKAALNQKITSFQVENTRLHTQLKDLKSSFPTNSPQDTQQLQDLQTECKRLRTQAKTLQEGEDASARAARAEAADLRRRVADLQARYELAQRETAAAVAAATAGGAGDGGVREASNRQQQELNTLYGKYAQVKEDLAAAREEIKALLEHNGRLSMELERVNADLILAGGAKESMLAHHANAEEARSSHSSDSNEESLASMTRQILVLQRTVMQLEKEKLVLQDALTRHLVERYDLESTRATQQASDADEEPHESAAPAATNPPNPSASAATATANGANGGGVPSSGMSTGSSSHNGASSLAPLLGPAAPLSPLTNSSRESKGIGSGGQKRKNEALVSVGKSLSASSASLAAGGSEGPRVDIKKAEGGKRGGSNSVGSPVESVGSAGVVASKRTRTGGSDSGGALGHMPTVSSGLRDRVKRGEPGSRPDSPQLPPFKRSKTGMSDTAAMSSVGIRKGETQAVNIKVSSIIKNERDRGGSAYLDTTTGGGGRYSSSSRLKPPNGTESAGTTPLPISSASPSPSLSAAGAPRTSSSYTQQQRQQQAQAGMAPAQAPKIKTLKSYLTSRDSPGAMSASSPSESSTGSITSANGGANATTTTVPAPSTAAVSVLDAVETLPPPMPLTGKNLAEWILKASFSRASSDVAGGPSATVLAVFNDPKSYGSGRGVDFLMREVLCEVWRNSGVYASAPEDEGQAGGGGSEGGRYSKSAKVLWEWCDLKRDVEDGEEVESVIVPYRSGSVRVEEGIPRDERNCVWFVWVLGCAVFNEQPKFFSNVLDWIENVVNGSEGRKMDSAQLCRMTRFHASLARISSKPSEFVRAHKFLHGILVSFSAKPRTCVSVIDGVAGCWPEAFKFRPRGGEVGDSAFAAEDGYLEVAFMMETCCVLIVNMVDELVAGSFSSVANMCQFAVRALKKSWLDNKIGQPFMANQLPAYLLKLFFFPDKGDPNSSVVIEAMVLFMLHSLETPAVQFLTGCLDKGLDQFAENERVAANLQHFVKRLQRGYDKRGNVGVEVHRRVLDFLAALDYSVSAMGPTSWSLAVQVVTALMGKSGSACVKSADVRKSLGGWIRRVEETAGEGRAVPSALKEYAAIS